MRAGAGRRSAYEQWLLLSASCVTHAPAAAWRHGGVNVREGKADRARCAHQKFPTMKSRMRPNHPLTVESLLRLAG